MIIEIIEVRNCKYQLEDNSKIYCEAKFSHIPDEWLPFTADPNDTEKHGRDIYNNAVNGDYGTVEAHTAAPEEEQFQTAMEELRAERNGLLASTDYYGMPDQVMTDAMKTYRQELRDLTNGLTTSTQVKAVVFPTKPE